MNFTNESIPDRIVKNVLDFYRDNKKDCDDLYNLANNNLSDMYIDLTDEKEINGMLARVSIIIVTANKYEKNILHLFCFDKEKERIKRWKVNLLSDEQESLKTYGYYFRWNDYSIFHLEAKMTGSHTLGGAADLTRYVITNNYLYPTAVISFGLCFGLDDGKDHRLGDVIISKKIYPYFIGSKISEKSFFVNDSNIFRINQDLELVIGNRVFDNGILNEQRDRVFFGNYITGEAVVSNYEIRDILAKAASNQPVIGGEMEGYGVFKECMGYLYNFPCLVVKSICDWGAVKNIENSDSVKDKIQAYAAKRSYEILNKLLSAKVFYSSLYEESMKYINGLTAKTHPEYSVNANMIKEKLQGIYIVRTSNKIITDDLLKSIIAELLSDYIIFEDTYPPDFPWGMKFYPINGI